MIVRTSCVVWRVFIGATDSLPNARVWCPVDTDNPSSASPHSRSLDSQDFQVHSPKATTQYTPGPQPSVCRVHRAYKLRTERPMQEYRIWHRDGPWHTWGHHFQGQKVKGQGHQAALLSVALMSKAAAAVSVGTYSAWESTATVLRCVCSAAREAFWRPPRGRRRPGHIVSPCAHVKVYVNMQWAKTICNIFPKVKSYNIKPLFHAEKYFKAARLGPGFERSPALHGMHAGAVTSWMYKRKTKIHKIQIIQTLRLRPVCVWPPQCSRPLQVVTWTVTQSGLLTRAG